eukprot:g377.t1
MTNLARSRLREMQSNNNTEDAKGKRSRGSRMSSEEMYKEASDLLLQCVKMKEAKFEPNDYRVAHSLMHLGDCIAETNKYNNTVKLYSRAVKIVESIKATGDTHNARLSAIYDKYGLWLFHNRNFREAEDYFTKSLAIREKLHNINVTGAGGQLVDIKSDLDFSSIPYDLRASLNNVAIASSATLVGKKMKRKEEKQKVENHNNLLRRIRAYEDLRWTRERELRG